MRGWPYKWGTQGYNSSIAKKEQTFTDLHERNKVRGSSQNSGGTTTERTKWIRRGYWESPQISGKQRKNETFGTKTSFISKSHSGDNIMSTTAFAIFKQELLGDMNELDEKIKTMMGWSKTRVKITCDTWHVTCGTWHLTFDIWHMTCDMWHTVRGEHSLQMSVP